MGERQAAVSVQRATPHARCRERTEVMRPAGEPTGCPSLTLHYALSPVAEQPHIQRHRPSDLSTRVRYAVALAHSILPAGELGREPEDQCAGVPCLPHERGGRPQVRDGRHLATRGMLKGSWPSLDLAKRLAIHSTMKKNPAAVALGRLGGKVKSRAKTLAVRANARKPRKRKP